MTYTKWPIIEFPTDKALHQIFIHLLNRLTQIQKRTDALIKNLMQRNMYCLPKYVAQGKLCSSSTSFSFCDYRQSKNESLKSLNTYLISEISIRNEEIRRRKVSTNFIPCIVTVVK